MTIPPYNPNIPQLFDSYASWQENFQNNFQQLFDAFGQNHVALDAANAGDHTVVEMLEQANPVQTNTAEIAMYAKDVSGQTDQTFMRFGSNLTEFQYTNYQIYSIEETDRQTTYFTFLPGKLIVYFGRTKVNNVGTITLNPPIATNIISMNFTAILSSSPVISSSSFVTTLIKEGSYFTGINLRQASGVNIPRQYYLILANC